MNEDHYVWPPRGAVYHDKRDTDVPYRRLETACGRWAGSWQKGKRKPPNRHLCLRCEKLRKGAGG